MDPAARGAQRRPELRIAPFIVQYFNWLSGQYLLICDIDDCVSEQICVNNEIKADDFDVSLLMSLLAIDDCILEELCVNNEIDADDFDVSLLTIDDDIFEYHERNVQRKKCARKSENRRSRPKLRERGLGVKGGSFHRRAVGRHTRVDSGSLYQQRYC